MKINFDQIFSGYPNHVNNKNYSFNDSQISTARGNDSLLTNLTKSQQQPRLINHKSSQFVNPSQFVNLIQNNQRDNYRYQYFKRSRLDDELVRKSVRSKKPQTSKINTLNANKMKVTSNKVTERLNRPLKCKKQKCHNLQLQQQYKRIQRMSLPLGAPQRNYRSLTQTCKMLQKPSNLHEKLYLQRKQRQLNNKKLTVQYEQERILKNTLQLYENQKYLKTYTGFYNRLEQEINRKVMKQQYYQRNPQIDIKTQGTAFQPNTIASKCSLSMLNHKPSILPKKQKCAIKGAAAMRVVDESALRRSLERSMYSLQNERTQAFIRQREDRIISGLCQRFEVDGEFCLNPETVSSLNEQEFELVFPVIKDLENEDAFDIRDFENRLRQHFAHLEGADRLKLRHMVRKKQMKKGKTTKCAHEMSQNMQKTDQLSQFRKNKSEKSDYLVKISNFV